MSPPLRALAAAIPLALLLSCTPVIAPAVPARDLVIGLVGEPATLLDDDPIGRAVAAAVIEPLVRRTDTEELAPRLVVSVPTFANGELALVEEPGAPGGRLVALFRLRQGARWHDGAPITADDVRFAFEMDRSADAGSAVRVAADRIDRVDVVDERTVRVSYRAGERWDLYALAPRAMPAHLLRDASAAARAQYARRPVHAGQYRVADRSGGTIVLEAFAEHVLGAPRIPRVIVRSYPNRSALIGALLAGEVDVVPSPGLEADLAATLDRSFGDRVSYKQAQAVATLRFGPRFGDPAVRAAAVLAIDRARIAASVFGGRARVPASYLVAPLWAAIDATTVPPTDRDEARAVLERAGARRGSFGIAELGGERLVGTLIFPQGATALEEAARAVAVDLALLGIAVDVAGRPGDEIEGRLARGEFDLALVVEDADDPLVATERYRGRVSSWYDLLADAARTSAERSEKRALYAEAQRIWTEAALAIPLFQALKVDVVPVRMDHVRPASHSAPITWNLGEWRPLER